MSYLVDGYHRETVASAPPSARVRFIRRTYAHLAGAVLAFVGIEAAIFANFSPTDVLRTMFSFNGSWLALMVLFIVSGFAAQAMARSRSSVAVQYAGLALFVLVEAVILLPILAFSELKFPGQNLPLQAGIVTLAAFGGLTAAVFLSGKDFSYLGPVLGVLALLSMVLVFAAVIGVLSLGLWFAVAMVALASGFIIYDTSNIIHHYSTDQYVSAALNLFASVALMFYYVLRIFLSAGRDE